MEDLIKGLQEVAEAQNRSAAETARELNELKEKIAEVKTFNSKLYLDECKNELLEAGFEAAMNRCKKGIPGKFQWDVEELKATKKFQGIAKAVSTSDTGVMQQTALNTFTKGAVEPTWLDRIPRYTVSGPSMQVPQMPTVSGVVMIAENTSDTAQAVAAGSHTLASTVLTPGVLGVRVPMTRSAVEKSYIDLVPKIAETSMRALSDAVQDTIINGDTADTLDVGGHVYATDDHWSAWDGLRKAAIASTPNKADLSTYTQLKLYQLIDAMGLESQWPLVGLLRGSTWGIVANGITGNVQYWSELAGRRSLGNYAGAEWFKTSLIPATDANGVIGASANSYSSLLVFAPEAYALGFGRDFGIEVEYSAYMQTYNVIATVDVDFKKTVAAAHVPVSVGYKMTL